jgi:hypothetical protein
LGTTPLAKSGYGEPDGVGGLNLIEFATTNPGINAVTSEKRDGWSKIRIQVDYGAVDHVMPKEAAPGINMYPTKASQAGKGYAAASGAKIANHGEKLLKGRRTAVQHGSTVCRRNEDPGFRIQDESARKRNNFRR